MADDGLLHIDGHTFDLDDLDYGERREIKRIARTEIYDEDVDGEFSDMNEDDLMPAIILVFMRRHDPNYTLQMARKAKPNEVFAENGGPPTQPQDDASENALAKKRSPRSSTAKKIPAASGSPS
jgi:hypothetical protein